MNDEMDDLNRLFRAAGDEYDAAKCDWCRDMLAAFVEAELAGEDAAALFPEVKEHLDTCADCEAEYAALLDLALAEESSLLPEAAGMSEPDLSFLRSASLPAFMRALVKNLAQSFVPGILAEIDSLLEPFLERAAALGDKPLPAMTPTLGQGPDALRILAATYGTTQLVVTRLSLADFDAQVTHQTLTATLRELAEQEALRQGFELEPARNFARQYAESLGQDTQALRRLIVKHQSK